LKNLSIVEISHNPAIDIIDPLTRLTFEKLAARGCLIKP
jgi:hypothetical protein